MRIHNQLTFTTYEASLKLKAHDPIKIIFDHIDWSFIHPLVKDKYSALPQGADGYDPMLSGELRAKTIFSLATRFI